MIGDSDGAEAALLIASYEPHLADAIVANSPSYLITGAGAGPPGSAAWTFDGKPLTTGALVPVADIRVPVLLSDGGQDLVWPCAPSATKIAQELRRSAERAPYTNLYYPGAGHTTAGLPPEIPSAAIVSGAPRGGSEQANALAAEQFWPEMIKFLDNPSRADAGCCKCSDQPGQWRRAGVAVRRRPNRGRRPQLVGAAARVVASPPLALTRCLGGRRRRCRNLLNRTSTQVLACPLATVGYPGLLADRACNGHGKLPAAVLVRRPPSD